MENLFDPKYLPLFIRVPNAPIGFDALEGDIGVMSELIELDALFKSLIACNVCFELFSAAEMKKCSTLN